MRKLDIHNKAQLVQYAIQKKIIKIPNLVRASACLDRFEYNRSLRSRL